MNHLPLLVLLFAAATVLGQECTSCNITRKSEIRRAEVLETIRDRLGFPLQPFGKIPAEVLAKARVIAQKASLHVHQEETPVPNDSVTVFALEVEDDDSNLARFPFKNDTKARGIARADLHLHLAKPSENPDERREVSIVVYDSTENGEKGELLASHRVLSPTHGHTHHRVRLNAEALERIAQKDAATLIVEAMLDGENLVVLPGDDDAEDHEMYLTVELAATLSRTRRSEKDFFNCKMGKKAQACCTFATVIDFEELGWNFILAPPKMYITGCAGKCKPKETQPMPTAPSTSRFREEILDALGHTETCCHPVKWEHQQIIYITPDMNIVDTVFSQLYVVKCACA